MLWNLTHDFSVSEAQQYGLRCQERAKEQGNVSKPVPGGPAQRACTHSSLGQSSALSVQDPFPGPSLQHIRSSQPPGVTEPYSVPIKYMFSCFHHALFSKRKKQCSQRCLFQISAINKNESLFLFFLVCRKLN